MFKKYGMELIVVNRRFLFETPNITTSAWFDTAWFCSGLNIGQQITYFEWSNSEWKDKSENWKAYLRKEGKLKPKLPS